MWYLHTTESTIFFDHIIFCAHRVQLKQDLVIASPDIFQVSLGSDAEFVLLASDGLWDYMKRFIRLAVLYIPLHTCKAAGRLLCKFREKERNTELFKFYVSAQMQLNLSGLSSNNMEMYRLSFSFLLKFSLILGTLPGNIILVIFLGLKMSWPCLC